MFVRLHNTLNALLLWLLPFSRFISMPAKSTAWLIWALAVLLAVSLAEWSYMPYPGMVVQLRIACARCHAVLHVIWSLRAIVSHLAHRGGSCGRTDHV